MHPVVPAGCPKVGSIHGLYARETLWLVTQDHELIDEVATRIWHFEDYKIEDFKGIYDQYQTVQV